MHEDFYAICHFLITPYIDSLAAFSGPGLICGVRRFCCQSHSAVAGPAVSLVLLRPLFPLSIVSAYEQCWLKRWLPQCLAHCLSYIAALRWRTIMCYSGARPLLLRLHPGRCCTAALPGCCSLLAPSPADCNACADAAVPSCLALECLGTPPASNKECLAPAPPAIPPSAAYIMWPHVYQRSPTGVRAPFSMGGSSADSNEFAAQQSRLKACLAR